MNNNLNNLFKKARKVRLEESEKADIKRHLLAYMKASPAKKDVASRNISPFRRHAMIPAISAALVVVFLAGGGAAFGAERALPGDALYPVKTKINEEVRAAFAFGAEARAEWEARRAERRMEEAAQLAAEGRLDAKMRQKLETQFTLHAERTGERIARMESKNDLNAAIRVASRFESSLKAHERVLARLGDRELPPMAAMGSRAAPESVKSDDPEEDAGATMMSEGEQVIPPQPPAHAVAARIGEHAVRMGEARASIEAKLGVRSAPSSRAAEEQLRMAERKIREVRQAFERSEIHIDTTISARVEAQLTEAENIIAEGKKRLSAEAYADALALFRHAYRIAQEAHILASAEIRFGITVDEEREGERENPQRHPFDTPADKINNENNRVEPRGEEKENGNGASSDAGNTGSDPGTPPIDIDLPITIEAPSVHDITL